LFSSDEFELLLNGQPFIDVFDWQINSTYKDGYSETDDVRYFTKLCRLLYGFGKKSAPWNRIN